MAINVKFIRESIEGDRRTIGYFKSEPSILLNSTQIQSQMEDGINWFDELIGTFTDEGMSIRLDGCRIIKLL